MKTDEEIIEIVENVFHLDEIFFDEDCGNDNLFLQKAQLDGIIKYIRKTDREAVVKMIEEMEGEHTDACGDSPLRECNPDCPQKLLSTLKEKLK